MSLVTLSSLDYDEEVVPEGLAELGSFNHSYLQVRLAVLLSRLEQYTVLTELSIDTTNLQDPMLKAQFRHTIKPDVCLYPPRGYVATRDELKMEEMPLLAIEILSPMQGIQRLISKMYAYFDLGVRSVWIVYPTSRTITVYASPDRAQSFSTGELIDETFNLTLSLANIFQ